MAEWDSTSFTEFVVFILFGRGRIETGELCDLITVVKKDERRIAGQSCDCGKQNKHWNRTLYDLALLTTKTKNF